MRHGGAQDGDLVASRSRARAARPADGAREGAARLAQERARGQPDRDPRPRHPACLSAGGLRPRPSGSRRDARRPRGLARSCRSSPSIRPTPRTTTTRCMPRPTRSEQSRRLHRHRRHRRRRPYVRPGSALDREALKRGNSVYFPDRVVPMLPERISNDLCSLRPHEDRARSRCAW
jgi:hypothetical protein